MSPEPKSFPAQGLTRPPPTRRSETGARSNSADTRNFTPSGKTSPLPYRPAPLPRVQTAQGSSSGANPAVNPKSSGVPPPPPKNSVPNGVPSINGFAAAAAKANGSAKPEPFVWKPTVESPQVIVTPGPDYQIASLKAWQELEHKHHQTINVERAFSYRFGGCSMPQTPQDNSDFYRTNWQKLTDTHDKFFVGTMFVHEFLQDNKAGQKSRLEDLYQTERNKIATTILAGGTVPPLRNTRRR